MAAPVWQSKGADYNPGGTGTSATPTLPASLAAGDIVVVFLYKENFAAVTPPAGYTEITGGGSPPQTTGQEVRSYWYRCVGGETGTVTFSWTGAVFRLASAHRFTGCVASGSPVGEIVAAFNNSISTTTPSVATAGTGGDECLVWCASNFNGGATFGAAAPSFTERADFGGVLAVDTRANVGGLGSTPVTATASVSDIMTATLLSLVAGGAVGPLVQNSRPGRTWRRRFKHPQILSASPAAAGTGFTVDQDDSVGLTDTSSIDVTRTITQTDSAGLTDSAILDQTKVFTDSAGLTDGTALTVSPVLTDSAGLTDTSLVELSKLVAQTDSAGLTDPAALDQSKTVTDSAGLTDSAAFTQSKVLTDNAGLTDTSLVESGKAITQTDSAGLTDSQSFSQTRVLTDSTGLTDSVGLTASKVLTDSAGLTDLASVGLLRDLAATDSVGLIDATVLFRSAALTDLVGLTDAAAFSQLRRFTDSAGLTDAATVTTVIPVPPFVPRPGGGVVPRPGSATTTRPPGGTTTRAASGLVPRPSSGFTPRP